jgi:hypothetical protein
MSEPRNRTLKLPPGVAPRERGSFSAPSSADGPNGTRELPIVREDTPPKAKRDNREYTGEPRPMLGWGFWPKVLLIAVLAVIGIAFLATNDFEFSAFAALFVVTVIGGGLFFIVFLIAKANKRDDDHSNPEQGPDKVEDHRGH